MSRARYHESVTQTWRATEKAQRRAEYLVAAGHLFAARGYHAVSIEDLGAAVGVSGPALYRHFASKEAMLVELLVDVSERLLVGFRRVVDESVGDLEAFRSLIAFHVDFALAERDVIRIQDRELANLPAEASHTVRRLQRDYLTGWQAIAARLRPELAASDLEVKMHALFGVVNSTPHNSKLEKTTDVRAVLIDTGLVTILGVLPEAVQVGS
jgi:AcrR family transcriptional regulator